MGRGEWRCPYKRTTLIFCSLSTLVALYALNSLYMYPFTQSLTTFKYSEDQIRKMEESNQKRKESEPRELIKLVTQLKKKIVTEERVVELPHHLKKKLIDEILDRLRSLDAAASAREQREAVESWRKEKLKEAKEIIHGKTLNSTILPEEAGVYARILRADWEDFSEEIGLWIPVEIINKEHDDKPEGEVEIEILPGRKPPPECNVELHTDYGGAAVRWGLTHPQDSAYDCCMACLDQAKNAKPGETKCNIWVYCPSETGCHSSDIYEHKNQECWLKYSETPKVSYKDEYSESYRNAHPNAPVLVPWVSGVVSV